jgi:hypothetical protein
MAGPIRNRDEEAGGVELLGVGSGVAGFALTGGLVVSVGGAVASGGAGVAAGALGSVAV